VVNGGNFSENTHDIFIWNALFYQRTITLTGFTSHPRITLLNDLSPIAKAYADSYLVGDTIILNFGPYFQRQLFFENQLPTAVPFPVARADVPSQYVGLSNLQLWIQYGVAVGGGVAPAGATAVPLIVDGLIGPSV
jgi:hypothetical protein